jgi:hypothetical protein
LLRENGKIILKAVNAFEVSTGFSLREKGLMPLTFTFRTQMGVLTYTFLIITDIKLKY